MGKDKLEKVKCALGVCTPEKVEIKQGLIVVHCKICGKILERTADFYFKRYIVRLFNTPVPVKVLTALSKDEDWSVRAGVAQNPNTPKVILEQLLEDEDWQVRYWASHYLSSTTMKPRVKNEPLG